ncbi:P-aminobenzoate N-oxygenase AurF [Saccharomonospora marina XMU15]|uniref:p-aminobenzoate N-oxygenase AurF n=1 Tax=Saccharomonospora marina XMU15 TaxID=882083 RepID=H5XAA7_9PSEU|nr:diiron oxygenase [Saccharomonospora marina]EHR49272.1 P-aminobenzoate N-oxygenase AurF [Saccharomonospora marina XMU15]
MTRTLRETGREKTAERLLKSSANKFYDPEVDIDWEAPLVEGKHYIPEHRCTLYGTSLWEGLTPQQRIELGKHEVASIATNGLWFEILLMQMLLKEVYKSDPTTSHAQYALTEIADECRHSTMFARMTERIGCPPYGPVSWRKRVGKLLPVIGYGPAMYGSILVAEEILDRMQREQMNDPQIQPLVRMVNRIHVLEEARHVTFAREEVKRGMANMSGPEKAYQRLLLAMVSHEITRSLVNPAVYKAVGIRPRDGYRAAMTNPHWQRTVRYAGERIMQFLDEVGLVGAPGMPWWRRSFLVGEEA